MPVIAYPTVSAGVNLAALLWRHRTALGSAFQAVGGVVESALTSPRPEIQRVGSVLLSVREDQRQVLAILHQETTHLDGITDAIAGVGDGQAALAHSLAALRSLSMVSLGLTGAAHLVLLHQFRRLGHQLTALAQTVHRIRGLVEAQQLGLLETGLTQLSDGVEDIENGAVEQGRTTLNANAADNLAQSVNTHAILLDRELRARGADPAVIRELFRHLVVGLLGEAGCHLALGNVSRARAAIERRTAVLEGYARAVFTRAIGEDAVRFLCPGMVRHGVTVESLAELFRQASHAGAIEGYGTVAATELIERWRDRLHTARDPWRGSTLDAMRGALVEAVSAVEEVNRVKSFATAIGHFERDANPFSRVTAIVRDEIACARRADASLTDSSCFAHFPTPTT